MLKKKFWFLILTFALIIGLTEIIVFALSYTRTLPFYQTPKLYQKILNSGSTVQKNWWTEREPWGVWHKNSISALHKSKCFNVKYNSNNIGARDSEFSEAKQNSFVLLGDSFAEGWGVEFEKTFSSLVEKFAGVNVLNFGSAGGMGPVQYKIIYDELAKKYEHMGIIILFYPANDFTDNDYDFWVKNGINLISGETSAERYRPYFLKVSPKSYKSFIPEKAEKRDNWLFDQKNKEWHLSWFLSDHFWTPNLIKSFKLVFDAQTKLKAVNMKNISYSGYFDATLEQQYAAISFIRQIIKLAPSKQIYLFSIPTLIDHDRVKNGSNPKLVYWQSELRKLESITSGSFVFTDLYDFMPLSPQTLFLECDPHWNDKGNIWAANIATKLIKQK